MHNNIIDKFSTDCNKSVYRVINDFLFIHFGCSKTVAFKLLSLKIIFINIIH
jgi:hypothetical protein